VGYPIMRADDVGGFVRTMEAALVAALADEGIEARTRPDDGREYTGVWAGERKIASIGIHVSRGVTTHGFAINVDNDLAPFEWVVACGLDGVRMTSVSEESATACAPLPLPAIRASIAERFAEAFERRPREVSLRELGVSLPPLVVEPSH
jgi:lipoyl(octanoyl) transferase